MSVAPGRPRLARVPPGDRLRYAADEGQASNVAPGRPQSAKLG